MAYPFENKTVDNNIKILGLFQIEKMEDYYLQVRFKYQRIVWNGAIPLRAKYQGVNVPFTQEDVVEWARICYSALNPAEFPENSVSAKDKESESDKKDDLGLPEGFDMSSLDDLDALMKEAGL